MHLVSPDIRTLWIYVPVVNVKSDDTAQDDPGAPDFQRSVLAAL
jgi:hypothetical protein